MDPTTTLMTFMLQTHPSVQSVHLVGSWDNFSQYYPMSRDTRRARGQWKGCYSFKDIICDDNSGLTPQRSGGLKMGRTYYFYYELDGSHETHDPTLPATNTCPYLPGQTVNTLCVPMEQTLRKRSASMSSMRNGDFMTMNPDDKFVTPRPAPPVPGATGDRLSTSPQTLRHKTSARSLSPAPSWRRFFCRKSTCSTSRGRRSGRESISSESDDSRSIASSESSRSRDISPESLLRFLSDDVPLSLQSPTEEKPSIMIPDEIAEENEDDDNFATSALSETMPYLTSLSPPPYKRTDSSQSAVATSNNSSLALIQRPSTPQQSETEEALVIPAFDFGQPKSRFSFSSVSSYASSMTPESNETPPSYFEEDEDEVLSADGDGLQTLSPTSTRVQSMEPSAASPIASYSLPQPSNEGTKTGLTVPTNYSSPGSPALLARHDSGLPMGNTSLLAAPIDTGLDDLATELGWVVDAIRGKGN